MLLGQIVAISFAMNLSFLTVLISDPAAAESASVFDSASDRTAMAEKRPAMTKPDTFKNYNGDQGQDDDPGANSNAPQKTQQNPSVGPPMDRAPVIVNQLSYIGSLLCSLLSIFLIPFSVKTRCFLYLLAVPHVLLFIPVVLPLAWFQTKPQNDAVTRASISTYRLVADSSFMLYLKATAFALTDEQFGGIESFVIEIYSHPAVSSVCSDVILCWLSAFLWISIHGPDGWITLREILPFVRHRKDDISEDQSRLNAAISPKRE